MVRKGFYFPLSHCDTNGIFSQYSVFVFYMQIQEKRQQRKAQNAQYKVTFMSQGVLLL